MKIFLPISRLNFSQIAYRKAREKSSFPLIILINFFQVLPQEPDEAAMALKLTLPQLGGGLKTSRGIFQPRTLNSPPNKLCAHPNSNQQHILVKASDRRMQGDTPGPLPTPHLHISLAQKHRAELLLMVKSPFLRT